MAHCQRCNKFMFLKSSSGYCKDCDALNAEEERKRKAEEERQRKAEEERKRKEEEERQCKVEEERKRKEEELRRKEEELCRKEEELRRKEEELRRKEEEEQKKTEEEKRRKEEEQCRRKANEKQNAYYPGNHILFGHYIQSRSGNITEPIEWLVLDHDRDNQRALLLSRYALDVQPYHSEYVDITWEECSLRGWLNSTFIKTAFSSEEQQYILTTLVSNEEDQNYSEYDTIGGNTTQDRVFLLSYAEAMKYFTDDGSRMCAVTDYSLEKGAHFLNIDEHKIDGKLSTWWWLRSPAHEQSSAMYVYGTGSLLSPFGRCYGTYVSREDVCVRPALWISICN